MLAADGQRKFHSYHELDFFDIQLGLYLKGPQKYAQDLL